MTLKQVTSPPWNCKEMVWASRWSVALRAFYRQILSLTYSFFSLKLPPPACPALLVYIKRKSYKCIASKKHTFLFVSPYIFLHFFWLLFVPRHASSFPLHSSSLTVLPLHFLFVSSSLLLSCLIFIHSISFFVLHSGLLCHVALLI